MSAITAAASLSLSGLLICCEGVVFVSSTISIGISSLISELIIRFLMLI